MNPFAKNKTALPGYFFNQIKYLYIYNDMATMGLKYLGVAVCLVVSLCGRAQSQAYVDTCDIFMQILEAAHHSYETIKGEQFSQTDAESTYVASVKLPGAVRSLVLNGLILGYEAVLYQGKSSSEMKLAYNNYRRLLERCIPANGYVIKKYRNKSNAKVARYDDITCNKPTGKNVTPAVKKKFDIEITPMVALLQATYSESKQLYTLKLMGN